MPSPLQNGDNLTRDDFERRYDVTPDGLKAELIDGVVYMPPAGSSGGHGRPPIKGGTVVGNYEGAAPGVLAFDNAPVRLDVCSMPQPDLGLLIDPNLGGTAALVNLDSTAAFGTLRLGLASTGHAAFVAELARRCAAR